MAIGPTHIAPPPAAPARLTSAERATLLLLARAAVEARVAGLTLPDPGPLGGRLDEPGAAFVSLHSGEELRGCLGCLEPRGPSLAATVVSMAASAAGDDPRFPPLTPGELLETSIEISVLGPLLDLAGPGDIVVGRDGLVVERDGRRGLLLPQVAPQWGWDAQTFLEETCRKAGLPRAAWREGARLHRFEAEVFSDSPVSSRPC